MFCFALLGSCGFALLEMVAQRLELIFVASSGFLVSMVRLALPRIASLRLAYFVPFSFGFIHMCSRGGALLVLRLFRLALPFLGRFRNTVLLCVWDGFAAQCLASRCSVVP